MFRKNRARKTGYRREYAKGKGGSPDFVLLGLLAFLTLFGWVMVYSSSVIVAFSQGRPSWYYFFRQLIWIIIGVFSAYILYKIDYRQLVKISPALIGLAIIMLISVLVVGSEINGASRWISFGFFDLQPSEFTKLAFIIYLAGWLSRKNKAIHSKNAIKNYFVVEMLPFLIILSIVLVLILIEPDLGTTAIIGFTALGMYYLAGEGYIHNLGFSALLIVSIATGILAAVLESYRLSRVKTFLEVVKTGNPPDRLGSGYQLSQILTAVGSGGILGVGFGQSKQKFNYLGETAFSDTIFAVIAEEFGLLGAAVIISCFLYFAIRGIRIAQKAPDKLSGLLAAGITIWITSQAFLNIAANIGLIPLTGITLPFLSYGGSSIIVSLSGIGILLNISKYVKLER